MSTKPKQVPGTDWLLASWQWAGEVSAMSGYGVQFSLTPTTRQGVWQVHARLLDMVDGRVVGTAFQTKGEWPNAQRVELGAYLMSLTMELDRLVAANVDGQLLPVDRP